VDTAREPFAASYPFHPTLLSVFERKWQALPRLQRTRGILRLLALWVSQTPISRHHLREEGRKTLAWEGLIVGRLKEKGVNEDGLSPNFLVRLVSAFGPGARK
jgi:hypothetical protein